MTVPKILPKVVLCIFFCVCGFLGNWFKVSLFFNVDFLFGSVFAMTALVLAGRTCGVLTAFVGGLCTYLLWNHPWAVIILTSETLVVSWLRSRGRNNLVINDLIYWIALGIPLVYLFYHQVMGLSWQDTLVVMLKQSINGVCNTLLASLGLFAVRLAGKKSGARTAYSDALFAAMLSFALLPTISLSVSAIRTYQEQKMDFLQSRVSSVSASVRDSMEAWIAEHHNNVQILASLIGDPNSASPEVLQHYVEILGAATPAFKGMGVFDAASISVAYSPLLQDGKSTLGVDMSARSHIAIMRRDKQPYITDMLMSKLGDPSPIVVFAAPVVLSGEYRGYCSGVVETSQVRDMLEHAREAGVHVTLVDGQNRVIVSTLGELKAMAPFLRPYLQTGEAERGKPLFYKPEARANISVMRQWRESFLYQVEEVSDNCRWRVVVEASLQPLTADISDYSLTWLSLQGLLVFAAVALSFIGSNRFIGGVQKLQVLSRLLTRQSEESSRLTWPRSTIAEIDELSANVEQMTLALLQNIADREENERRITHINRVLDSIRLINRLIVYETDRRSLLQRACELLIETRGYRTAWAALYDDRGRLTVFAQSGFGDEIDHLLAAMEEGRMPECYLQVKSEKMIVLAMSDLAAQCATCPLASNHRDGTAMVGTLRHNEREYGLLAVTLPVDNVDEANEQALFGELSGDLGYALYSIEQEEKRRQAEELYSLLFSGSVDGILIAEAKSKRFRFANPAICRFLGYSREELLTLGVPSIHPPESVDDILAGFESQAREEMVVMTDVACLRKDGTVLYADVTAAPIVIEGNLCLAGFFRDITARKSMEEDRRRLQNQLLQAQKMESVGRLAGGVAHDYNNMLSVILGYTEMALDDTEPGHPLHEPLQAVFSAARRSAEITRQLLAFARKQTIAPVVLDINETISGMLNMLRRLLGENVTLHWAPDPEVWQVKMDPSQIDQILANLCVNARDAIVDIGRITIETGNAVLDEANCARHSDCQPGDYVMLAVSDTGCGMDSKTVEKIFEPYFTTKEIGKGTGLGMSTVYGIVKQNGGAIGIYSEPGKGTTVRIYIPRFDSPLQALAVEEPGAAPLGNGETLLLVEDDFSVRQLGRTMLERSGYTVLAAASPGEALALAREHAGRIELLVTDVVMPEMNGKELATKLHNLYPHLKVLYMSGYTANAIAHHGVLDDGVNFIEKPFSYKNLRQKIHAVLSGAEKASRI